ncbi:MCE family protein [Nocardia shimofusensis]|uniref:MCE family protein n=1 Tax=Nocardia shimofusensis TaxID=228596 RepID=UPI0027D791A9|nr:MCE family protein [Nocardia shimofusensis]
MTLVHNVIRPLAGTVAMALCALLVAGAVQSFRGAFADTVAVQVLSQRAGLVMNPDADVKMRGVTVGKVSSIRERPDGTATLELAIDTDKLARIPGNVSVAIASTTVFGAKYVQLIPPERPADQLRAGQVLTADRVTVEINTVFEQLTAVLAALEPEKLNATLGSLAAATRGRGTQVGEMLSDLETFLAELEPALPDLRTDIGLAAPVLNTYADAAQPLLDTAGNLTSTGGTLLEEQQNLDAMLLGLIGLSDTGNRVLSANASALATTLDVLVPTTALTAEYREALYCSLDGFADLSQMAPVDVPGLGLSANFLWGIDPYRYPENLPKLRASGGSQCSVLPVGYEQRPPFVVADVGADPFARGNQGIVVNPDSLPNALFGPSIGGPR